MDVYAALNPITSSSYSQSIYTSGGSLFTPGGGSGGQMAGVGQSLEQTTLLCIPIFWRLNL
jgi:hypothetical protein